MCHIYFFFFFPKKNIIEIQRLPCTNIERPLSNLRGKRNDLICMYIMYNKSNQRV